MFPIKTTPTRPLWFWAFLLLLVLVPLPFGSNRPWASDLLGVLSGLLLLAALIANPVAVAVPGKPPRARLLFAAGGFALIVLWSFVQTLSITPESWHHPIWAETGRFLGNDRRAISLSPDLFFETLVRFLIPPAFFILAFEAGRARENAKLIVKILAYAGVAYAFYGLVAQASGGEAILWYKKWAYQGFLTSTFVNKNSYAAYAGLGLLCAIVFVRDRLNHVRVKDGVLARHAGFVAFLAALELRDYIVFLSPAFLLAALALTGSRAGVASSLFGVAILFLCMAVFDRWSLRRWAVFVSAVLFAFAFFAVLGGDALFLRLEGGRLGEDSATRLAAYQLTRQAIADNPWFGFGLGSFDHAFRLYRDSSLPLWFHHAHNDYLEMAMDLGLPAAAVLFISIMLMVGCCFEGVLRRKRDAIYPALGVAASALIGAHVLVDFSLHIPAIAASYACLLGVGVAQSFSSRGEKKPAQSLSFRPASSLPKRVPAPAPVKKETASPPKRPEEKPFEKKESDPLSERAPVDPLVPNKPSPHSRRKRKKKN